MPPELAEQMPVLKDLLRALGYKIVTKEGYEADDILGTLCFFPVRTAMSVILPPETVTPTL